MLLNFFILLLIHASRGHDSFEVSKLAALTPYLMHINDLPNVAHFQDAEHRGPAWYDYSLRSKESASDLESGISSISDASDTKESTDSQTSSFASSKDTKERRRVTDMHRACTPCPHEMMKNFKNIGIKWICGAYQRARRSFKSVCMMRFRNCQDGTMFVKIADHKCGIGVDVAIIESKRSEGSKEAETTTKKKVKKDRSTSSSSNEKKASDSSGDSLDLSLSESSGSGIFKKKKKKPKDYKPKSSNERFGWRKWHRKCQQCPEDMRKKWREPDIKWICGGYQRARRTFKSLCMMHFRNCQDGTMFTKIADHRCPNDTSSSLNYIHGDHFFYDYSVALSMDSSKSDKSSSSETVSISKEMKSWDSSKMASFERNAINDLAFI